MRCAKLGAAIMINKNQYRHPDRETGIQMDIWMLRRMEGRTDGRLDGCTDGHRSSTGPHWVPLDLSMGINASQPWTPILEKIILIKKSQMARRRPDRQTYGHIILSIRGFYPIDFGCMCCTQLQAAQIIAKKRHGRLDRETESLRDRETEIQTYIQTYI